MGRRALAFPSMGHYREFPNENWEPLRVLGGGWGKEDSPLSGLPGEGKHRLLRLRKTGNCLDRLQFVFLSVQFFHKKSLKSIYINFERNQI